MGLVTFMVKFLGKLKVQVMNLLGLEEHALFTAVTSIYILIYLLLLPKLPMLALANPRHPLISRPVNLLFSIPGVLFLGIYMVCFLIISRLLLKCHSLCEGIL